MHTGPAMLLCALAVPATGCVIPAPLDSQDPALVRPVIVAGIPDFRDGRYFPLRGAGDGGTSSDLEPFGITVFYPDATVAQLFPALFLQRLDGTFQRLDASHVLIQTDLSNPHTYQPPNGTIDIPFCNSVVPLTPTIDWQIYVYVADRGPWPRKDVPAGSKPDELAPGSYDFKYWVVNCAQ